MSCGSLLGPSTNTYRKEVQDQNGIGCCEMHTRSHHYVLHCFQVLQVLQGCCFTSFNEWILSIISFQSREVKILQKSTSLHVLAWRQKSKDQRSMNQCSIIYNIHSECIKKTPGSLNRELIHRISWSAQTTGLYDMPVSSSVLLLQPPVRAVTVSCSSTVLIYSTSSPPSISLTRLQKRSITTIWRKFSSIIAAPVRGNPSAAEPLIRRRVAPAADLQRRTPRRCAAEGAAVPAAAHRERPHGAWQPGRPASGTPSASMGPAPGRGGRSLAASGMDSRPPVSARHHLGRAGGRGGPRAVPAELRALRGAQVLRRAGGGRRRVPAVVRGGGEADGGSPARPRRLSDPTGRRGREASLRGPRRGGGEARPASLRSLPWGRLSFSRRAWAEGPRVWEPSPPAQRGQCHPLLARRRAGGLSSPSFCPVVFSGSHPCSLCAWAQGETPCFPPHGPCGVHSRIALSLPLRSERVQGIHSLPLPLFLLLLPSDNWAGREEPVQARVPESSGSAVCPQGSAFGGPRGDVQLGRPLCSLLSEVRGCLSCDTLRYV